MFRDGYFRQEEAVLSARSRASTASTSIFHDDEEDAEEEAREEERLPLTCETAPPNSRPGHGTHDGGYLECFAWFVIRCRYAFLVLWLVSTAVLAPYAYLLLGALAPFPKEAPPGTESAEAGALFDEHFPHLSGMKRESIVFSCRAQCESAANDLAKGLVLQVQDLVERFGHDHPGTIIHVHSYFSYRKLHDNPMISSDKQSILLQWLWRVPDNVTKIAHAFLDRVSAEVELINRYEGSSGREGLVAKTSGPTFLEHELHRKLMEEIPQHEMRTLWLPFSILACALRSVRLLMLTLLTMPVRILVAFGLTYFIAVETPFLSEAMMEMLVLCTGLAFDYSLFTLRRFAEELEGGAAPDEAIVTMVVQSGHVVFVTGFVLMIAFGAMLALPMPFKSFCYGCCTMIPVCMGVQLTLIPAILAVCPWLGGVQEPGQNGKESDSRSWARLSVEAPKADEQGHEDLCKDPANGAGAEADDFRDIAFAKPYMHGVWFWVGGRLTAWPLNVFVPFLVYLAMAPLTLRMIHGRMGHGFQLEISRHAQEWSTALQIQEDFSSSVGCFYPMLIIATRELPVATGRNESGGAALGIPAPAADGEGNSSREQAHVDRLDVRSQEFFDANCHMVNSLIQATNGSGYALLPSDFQSVTFHAKEGDRGPVECLNYYLTHAYRRNFFTKTFLASSHLLQMLWEQLVSEGNDAMITIVNPRLDPFSTQAFELVREMRRALQASTKAASEQQAGAPGLEFALFSATGAMMDTMALTGFRLPISLLTCAIVSFVSIAVSFRAALMPFKLFLTVIVPMTWSYGATLYVFDDGVLEWLGYAGLSPTGNFENAGVHWTVFMLTPCVILGLALDYDIFLFTRVWEFRSFGFGDAESIQLGLTATGPIITQAGLIFALTFGMMVMGSSPVSNQMGFCLVFSVLVDTFVVRTVLVPAILSLSPELNFWPTKMGEVRYEWLKIGDGVPKYERLIQPSGKFEYDDARCQ